MSKDFPFPEIAVKRENKYDGKLTGGQDRREVVFAYRHLFSQ